MQLRGLVTDLDVIGLARAKDGLDKEIAGPRVVIRDVVDSRHSDTTYIHKLRWPARAIENVVEFSVYLCHL